MKKLRTKKTRSEFLVCVNKGASGESKSREIRIAGVSGG